MSQDFKISVLFNQDGEEIEEILSRFLISLLNEKNNLVFSAWKEEKCLKK